MKIVPSHITLIFSGLTISACWVVVSSDEVTSVVESVDVVSVDVVSGAVVVLLLPVALLHAVIESAIVATSPRETAFFVIFFIVRNDLL